MDNILLIKNMVCRRCVMTVTSLLEQAGIAYDKVVVGEVHLSSPVPEQQRLQLAAALAATGLELIDNRTTSTVEKIKRHVIAKARNEVSEAEKKIKLSAYLADKLHHEYTYLSNLFSTIEGRTIENYFIEQRIEKAKELLVYGEQTLSEIADALGYSSVAHLSGQFKKVTGLTPSHFKEIGSSKRKALDKI